MTCRGLLFWERLGEYDISIVIVYVYLSNYDPSGWQNKDLIELFITVYVCVT